MVPVNRTCEGLDAHLPLVFPQKLEDGHVVNAAPPRHEYEQQRYLFHTGVNPHKAMDAVQLLKRLPHDLKLQMYTC